MVKVFSLIVNAKLKCPLFSKVKIRDLCCGGFSGSFLPLLGHNLNIFHPITDVIPSLRQMIMPLSAGKSAWQHEPRQKQLSLLGQECDILSFTILQSFRFSYVAGIEIGAIPARVPLMYLNSAQRLIQFQARAPA